MRLPAAVREPVSATMAPLRLVHVGVGGRGTWPVALIADPPAELRTDSGPAYVAKCSTYRPHFCPPLPPPRMPQLGFPRMSLREIVCDHRYESVGFVDISADALADARKHPSGRTPSPLSHGITTTFPRDNLACVFQARPAGWAPTPASAP